MSEAKPDVVVAGHLCLDVIPSFLQAVNDMEHLVEPGKLVEVGPVTTSTGGAVANTGLTLHLMGFSVRLMGKVGDDLFGRAILDAIARHGPALANGIKTDPTAPTSYTLVLNPPGTDRFFMHCPGTNDVFGPEDIAYDELTGIRLFHFGYPPLMRRMYSGNGEELAAIYRRAGERGVTTSLDMALPDPESDAGKQDWVAILSRVLPHVDVFLPSFDETLAMLRPALSDAERLLVEQATASGAIGPALSTLAEHLLRMGTAVVALKLGDRGLYLRTTADAEVLAGLGNGMPADPASWLGRELLIPCYNVKVAATTGAGDTTIAGLLGGLLKGLGPIDAIKAAVGAGAFNVENKDTINGTPRWAALMARLAAGWAQQADSSPGEGWTWNETASLWSGPSDTN